MLADEEKVSDAVVRAAASGPGSNVYNLDHKMLRRSALLAARAGEHDLAVELLLKAAKEVELGEATAAPSPAAARAPAFLGRGSTGQHKSTHKLLDERLDPPTQQLLDDSGDEIKRLFFVMRELLTDGLPQPWPATLVSLGFDHIDAERRVCTRLPIELLQTLFKMLVRLADPFAPHKPVLVYQKDTVRLQSPHTSPSLHAVPRPCPTCVPDAIAWPRADGTAQ